MAIEQLLAFVLDAARDIHREHALKFVLVDDVRPPIRKDEREGAVAGRVEPPINPALKPRARGHGELMDVPWMCGAFSRAKLGKELAADRRPVAIKQLPAPFGCERRQSPL